MCDEFRCGENNTTPLPMVASASRRRFIQGLGTLPLAAVLAWPDLVKAAAARLTQVQITTAGGQSVSAALALPKASKAPAVLLIHEWWGLNDQIKAVAQELATMGYVALAIDLYKGQATTSRTKARELVGSVKSAEATETLVAWSTWLRKHARGNGKVGVMGWCFGGGWSLNTALATKVDAAVVYYGNVSKTKAEVKNLNAPVLGHFATKDKRINQAMVNGFAKALQGASKGNLLRAHWYDAHHAFANPTGSRYDAQDAALAWKRTTAFLKQHLKTTSAY